MLVHGLAEGSPAALDFSVTHPLQLSGNLAEVRSGIKAKEVERQKSKESRSLCLRAGWSHHPFVLETMGSWGGQARFVSQRLVRVYALHEGISVLEAGLRVRARLGGVLLRSVCRQLERGFPETPVVARELFTF